MKCPYCNKEMYHPVGKPTWSCQNWDCLKSEGMIGNHVLWQELIRTRKALELAITGLKNCKTRDHIGAVCRTPEYVDKILEQINTITKGGDNE